MTNFFVVVPMRASYCFCLTHQKHNKNTTCTLICRKKKKKNPRVYDLT